jgi:hypothetical protein
LSWPSGKTTDSSLPFTAWTNRSIILGVSLS